MADGSKYDPRAMTVAYNALPLGTRLRICRLRRCVVATVTDRMKYSDRVDLSEAVAEEIGIVGRGKVRIEPVKPLARKVR